MLRKTSPEILSLTEQLENLYFLRDETFPFVKKKRSQGLLDLNHYYDYNSCGDKTHCLFGWFCEQKGIHPYMEYNRGYGDYEKEYFGLLPNGYHTLMFGAATPLESRYRALTQELIPYFEQRLEQAMSNE